MKNWEKHLPNLMMLLLPKLMLMVIRHLVLDLGSLVFPRLSIFQKEVRLQKSKLLILLILLNMGLTSYTVNASFSIFLASLPLEL